VLVRIPLNPFFHQPERGMWREGRRCGTASPPCSARCRLRGARESECVPDTCQIYAALAYYDGQQADAEEPFS
jgi:hypothetical protein